MTSHKDDLPLPPYHQSGCFIYTVLQRIYTNLLTSRRSRPPPFVCEVINDCPLNKVHLSFRLLRDHENSEHNAGHETKKGKYVKVRNSVPGVPGVRYQCDVCLKSFTTGYTAF